MEPLPAGSAQPGLLRFGA
ncbi:unnamed protein product, partial [Rotaria magnacalcarata]